MLAAAPVSQRAHSGQQLGPQARKRGVDEVPPEKHVPSRIRIRIATFAVSA
jgi:hypothetical protein